MDFIKSLPKIELHAHLNGSLSNATLLKLRQLKYGDDTNIDPQFYQIMDANLTLSECFLKFKYAHDLTDSWDALKLATECMIQDFALENTIYLEIRSTPKKTVSLSKEDYLEAIIAGIESSSHAHPNTLVKLIVSVNRADGPTAAQENLEVALKLHQKYPNIIKGMDLSGDPLKFFYRDFAQVFVDARNAGLGIAIHAAEVNEKYEDVKDILDFGPDRIGHGTFVEESGLQNWQTLRKKKIPVECCLTSNVKCGTVKNYEDHHLKKLFQYGHPVAICTDDFGVFDTSLSQEIELTAKHINLSNWDLMKIMQHSVDFSFASDAEKKMLHEKLDQFKKENLEVLKENI
ncbi:adenosine deaminase-like protein [Culicoides brevitarsis]|uniref:adenosine deaminase-like protein n=1 Tax=Culicoides brevitarsis TaxID=469753 RepID=UPI00307BD341